MTKIPQAEKMDQGSQSDSSGSNSSNDEAHGGSSKTSESKHRSKSSSKDPTALFMVGSTTQDSALWSGLVQYEADGPKTATVCFVAQCDSNLNMQQRAMDQKWSILVETNVLEINLSQERNESYYFLI